MQADFVKKRPALKHGYIDPSPIASTNFNYHKEWKLDCKELGAGKTLKEKEDIRNKKILEESSRLRHTLLYVLKISNNTILYGYHTTSSKFDCILSFVQYTLFDAKELMWSFYD